MPLRASLSDSGYFVYVSVREFFVYVSLRETLCDVYTNIHKNIDLDY